MSTDVTPALDLDALRGELVAAYRERNRLQRALDDHAELRTAAHDLSRLLSATDSPLPADVRARVQPGVSTVRTIGALLVDVTRERDEARAALDKVRELTRGLRVTVGAVAEADTCSDVDMEDEIHDLWLTIDQIEAALGPPASAAPASAPAPLRRGDLVVRRGQEGTVVYVDKTSWVVVGANRLDEEDNRGPDFSAGWGDTPEAAGWVRA